ncbi:MAG: hypothetical protein ACOX9C_04035 [Kiritimatiellia bacterium]|jgi:hypothetical protein
MTRPPLRSIAALSLTALLVCLASAGCEHDDDFAWNANHAPKAPAKADDKADAAIGEAKSFVGTWHLHPDKGGAGWYAFFNADGTWKIADDREGNRRRVFGNYRVANGKLEGDMTNPGVGTGAINATISPGGIMALDFIEHWHDPHKVVTYSGSKL